MKRLHTVFGAFALFTLFAFLLPASLTAQEPTETITTIAGNGASAFSGDDGPAAQASLNDPTGVAVDARGNVYVADRLNNRIRSVEGEHIAVVIGASDTSRRRR